MVIQRFVVENYEIAINGGLENLMDLRSGQRLLRLVIELVVCVGRSRALLVHNRAASRELISTDLSVGHHDESEMV